MLAALAALGAGSLLLSLLPAGCGEKSDAAGMQPAAAGAQIERGRYLVEAMGCTDCHSPHDQTGQPIPGRELTGHPAGAPLPQWDPAMLEKGVAVTIAPTLTAFSGPFGTSIASNLTPDPATGIGNMKVGDLVKSWRMGTHWQTGQAIKPPMPWPGLGKLTDEDIHAIFAYLMSLPARSNGPLSTPPG
ncbi:MAG: c-type cytochrome [Phycisphaerales bacterium]|nr:c-type cytochrome [Phycisphaerales bacterium]